MDKVVSGVSFNTTLEQPPQDMHEIESPFEPAAVPGTSELVINRATPIAEEEDFVEPEKEEKERKRRSTKESRETAATEASNVEAAKEVGALIAKRALEKNIKTIVFDRSGYVYHGVIKELAEAARESCLEF